MTYERHGYGKSKGAIAEYNIWRGIKDRCNNPNNRGYHRYGGRGIKICKKWEISFKNFLNDMGMRPSKFHSLDRINNDKGYYPKNCRWAIRKLQQINTRTPCNNKLKLKGISYYPRYNKYRARITIQGKLFTLGYFISLQEAIDVYNKAAKERMNLYLEENNKNLRGIINE